MRQRKFVRDETKFLNVFEAVTWIMSGRWVFWGTVPKHHSIVKNMALIVLSNAADSGHLRRALPAPVLGTVVDAEIP